MVIQDSVTALGDSRLLLVVLENLIGNAWKFTRGTKSPRIEFGTRDDVAHDTDSSSDIAYFVRDNGAGFDMQYSDKLFRPFSRLHGGEEYEGIGIGLATVARIIHRHGGSIWAEGEVGVGATLYFTLPDTVDSKAS